MQVVLSWPFINKLSHFNQSFRSERFHFYDIRAFIYELFDCMLQSCTTGIEWDSGAEKPVSVASRKSLVAKSLISPLSKLRAIPWNPMAFFKADSHWIDSSEFCGHFITRLFDNSSENSERLSCALRTHSRHVIARLTTPSTTWMTLGCVNVLDLKSNVQSPQTLP